MIKAYCYRNLVPKSYCSQVLRSTRINFATHVYESLRSPEVSGYTDGTAYGPNICARYV
jgi:hypothetical protein